MGVPFDKLSRVSALRPASTAKGGDNTAHRKKSLPLPGLDTEQKSNHLGEHLVLRRWFPDPKNATVGDRALQLLGQPDPKDFLDTSQWIFLDTETTGLSGGTGTYPFLVGIAWWEDGGLMVEQLFMRDHSEEPSMLLALSERFGNRPILVTYNGKSFDWPLLETRYRITRAAKIPKIKAHLDLFHPARQLWRLRLGSVSLVGLEKGVLNRSRQKDIPAQSIPGRYFNYLRGGAAGPIAEVFHHNQMDLQGLAALTVKISLLLQEPEGYKGDAGELYGLSRILQRRGEYTLACEIYQRAIAKGLPEPEGRTAKREVALIARRQQEFAQANSRWEELLGDTNDGLLAYEQLAIHYEHRTREPERAAALSREALIRLHEGHYSGRIPYNSYSKWHARFRHRLHRLRGRTAAII